MAQDPETRFPTLFFLWALAVLALVITLGYVWRSGTRFLLVILVWLVAVSPLMVATARWLAARQRE